MMNGSHCILIFIKVQQVFTSPKTLEENNNIKNMIRSKSNNILLENEKWIPGGVVSLNRKADPNICLTDEDGILVVRPIAPL